MSLIEVFSYPWRLRTANAALRIFSRLSLATLAPLSLLNPCWLNTQPNLVGHSITWKVGVSRAWCRSWGRGAGGGAGRRHGVGEGFRLAPKAVLVVDRNPEE